MPLVDLVALATEAAARLLQAWADPVQRLALLSAAAAGVLVLVSAFVRTMIPLRWLAVGSSLGFIVYGLLHPSWLMVALHATLLPVNLFRAVQMVRLSRRVRASTTDPRQLAVWMRPYMRSRRYAAGRMIFQVGQLADRLYFLADGEVELPEVGRRLQPGQMFGEIAFFTPDRRRGSSARCITASTVLSIDEATFRQLVYQNPDFGLEIVHLIAGRLSQDVQRLQAGPHAEAGADLHAGPPAEAHPGREGGPAAGGAPAQST